MENISLVDGVIHSLKSIKNPSMLIKLDMSKDFNYLIFKYIYHILLVFSLIHSYGIRKVDTLSHSLFTLKVEGLGKALQAVVILKTLKGLKIHGTNPSSSHQHFIDATLFMDFPMIWEYFSLKKNKGDF